MMMLLDELIFFIGYDDRWAADELMDFHPVVPPA
jgi:hypothetical protein